MKWFPFSSASLSPSLAHLLSLNLSVPPAHPQYLAPQVKEIKWQPMLSMCSASSGQVEHFYKIKHALLSIFWMTRVKISLPDQPHATQELLEQMCEKEPKWITVWMLLNVEVWSLLLIWLPPLLDEIIKSIGSHFNLLDNIGKRPPPPTKLR